MLVVGSHTPEDESIPLRLLSIDDGTMLRQLRQPIRVGKKVQSPYHV